jgi:hypothetical protein
MNAGGFLPKCFLCRLTLYEGDSVSPVSLLSLRAHPRIQSVQEIDVIVPNTHSIQMSIIDSLKRLERIGDDKSKTTQKLIQAAEELAESIVQQFAAAKTEHIDLPTEYRKTDSAVKDATDPAFKETEFESYAIHKVAFYGSDVLQRYEGYVARDRDNALRFSKDVAHGLLDSLVEILAERLQDAEAGLAAIQEAKPKIG